MKKQIQILDHGRIRTVIVEVEDEPIEELDELGDPLPDDEPEGGGSIRASAL